jgi:RNA polymerase sigma factor (sigma-70 family)
VSNEYIGLMFSDQEFIKGCASGDRAVQKALYERYCRKMMAVCLRYAGSEEEAEDILQEGFVKVFKNIHTFRGESRLDTWIARIMINTSLNHQRHKMYLIPLIAEEDIAASETEEVSLAEFHLAELIAIVQSLPDGCRLVFNLFAIEGYSHKEIAKMAGISEGTSKSQYNRAKNLLRIRINEPGRAYKRYEESHI